MDDSRFFSMNQLWQSLAFSVVIGGVLVTITGYGLSLISKDEGTQARTATTTQEVPTLPAAAVEAVSALPAAAVEAVSALPTDPFTTLSLSAQSAIVVDLSNGHTLYSQNADAQLPLASLTKLLTVYGAQRVLSDASLITISSTSLAQDGEYGLTEGETFSYKDSARLALTASSNDVAQAIAEAAAAVTGQTPAQFMQGAIRSAGLLHTKAANGTGLDIDITEAGAYGSARDMAQLANEFYTSAPDISKATTKRTVSVTSKEGVAHTLPNTNPIVSSLTGILLSKTGYTDLAGGNLVVIFDAGINHPVAVVVLGSTRDARFTDVTKLVRATRASLSTQPAP